MGVNKSLLPIKAHFFLYWGYVASVVPYMMVVARQLGVPVGVQGVVWAAIMTASVLAKPVIAALADSLPALRKTVFLVLLAVMVTTMTPIGFLAPLYPSSESSEFRGEMVVAPTRENSTTAYLLVPRDAEGCLVTAAWNCTVSCHHLHQPCPHPHQTSDLRLSLLHSSHPDTPRHTPRRTQQQQQHPSNAAPPDDSIRNHGGFQEMTKTPNINKLTRSPMYHELPNDPNTDDTPNDPGTGTKGSDAKHYKDVLESQGITTKPNPYEEAPSSAGLVYLVEGWPLYQDTPDLLPVSWTCMSEERRGGEGGAECGGTDPVWAVAGFWLYLALLLVGQIAASTVESVSDAICCDTIGEGGNYGSQRVWGVVSYGLLGLLSGLLVDWSSGAATVKDYRPAFLLSAACGILDLLLAAASLKVPREEKKGEASVWVNLRPLLRHHRVLVFLFLAFLIGFFDGLDTTYVFVLQEDMAAGTATVQHLKLLQGLTLLVQAASAVPCMLVCDGLIKRLGSERVITLVLFLYTMRLLALALASGLGAVWATVAIEVINGPCFGLGFTAVVVHASSITPQGTSTTVQSVVGVCYSTLGYAGASLAGGVVYEGVGGTWLYLLTGLVAALTCLIHLVYLAITRHASPDKAREMELGAEFTKINSKDELKELNILISPEILCQKTSENRSEQSNNKENGSDNGEQQELLPRDETVEYIIPATVSESARDT